MRRIFGPKRDEVTAEWKRLNKNEFYTLYSSPNIIRVIKSRKMRWQSMWHVWTGESLIQDSGRKTRTWNDQAFMGG
jgi:hypothetical protein